MNLLSLLKRIGPGLIYAGAAIGVSHLVQSTRAGADYGLQLVIFIFLANLFKFPALETPFLYSAKEKNTLISAYASLDQKSPFIVLLLTLSTMVFIQAAVTTVTAGIFSAIFLEFFHIQISLNFAETFILTTCLLLSAVGKYQWLDRLSKFFVFTLGIIIVVCTIIALFEVGIGVPKKIFDFKNLEDYSFLLALIGWMPAPLDISVWTSLWLKQKNSSLTNAKQQNLNKFELLFDFHLSHWITAILAIFFLLLGALTLSKQTQLPTSSVEYCMLLIKSCEPIIGTWSIYAIGISAFFAMISTSLTCFDAPALVLKEIYLTTKLQTKNNSILSREFTYHSLLFLLTLLFLLYFKGNMKSVVTLATHLSFLSAPYFAWMNLRVEKKFLSDLIPRWRANFAALSLFILCAFTLSYFIFLL